MEKEIYTQEIEISKEDTIRSFKNLQPSLHFSVDELLYYPYLFFEHSFARKNPLSPLKGIIGSTVDGISGVAALADKAPTFQIKTVSAERLLPSTIQKHRAVQIAEDYIFRTLSTKIKVLLTPKVTLQKQLLFYRPYWIVDAKQIGKDDFRLMVDGVSGKYHPL
ncbi:hypothetical protein MHB50_04505 [Siminovitchia sp. FSL H7-0308]|uniref:hypothetical protein n=1 Tax=Siminovitchia sp. FSL H7-0308 TaxID=2921432 RepID=UPI0030EF6FC7